MEENENENENSHKKLNPISIKLLLSSHADPLFSSIVTLYILILLYFPHIIFSPVLIITFTLLLHLLRFGATQRNESTQSNCTPEAADHQTKTPSPPYSDQDLNWVACKDSNFAPNPCFEDSFVEWNVRAPLQVIYEAYEGEEEEEEEGVEEENVNKDPLFLIERYDSLSFYYPETDSDTSSDGGGDFLAVGDWGSPESVCFRLEDEEDREGLIEIALDNKNKRERLDFEMSFHGEEENNLIEIDISPLRDEEKWRFSGQC